MPDSWLVVPCFNEARRLDRAAFERFMCEPGAPFILFVDDGSSDGTEQVLHEIAAGATLQCGVLQLPQNRGKAEAVRAGMNAAAAAGASYVAFWDADLATPLEAYHELLSELQRSTRTEVAMGARVRMLGRTINRSGSRHYIGRVFATLASLVLRLPVYDTQCGAKLFRMTPSLQRALAAPFRSRWGFDVELVRRLQLCWQTIGTDRIVEVPLREWHDVGGSKVSLAGGIAAFVALLRIARIPEPAPLSSRTAPEEPAQPATAMPA